jgi:hypothetical protein
MIDVVDVLMTRIGEVDIAGWSKFEVELKRSREITPNFVISRKRLQ